ncbi:GGDEF domain-containing protein [Thiomicrorhabdus sediminis]|uniref:diguanylate cyclase n=1 Tax=Thiomicrorhabdus sediminis TaxID=2580412 RepID=A0A4V1HI00_9GAMM|nr:GGDEF domain-containing protein [Thiomicrorhabdus sediminis]QCU90793.1 diguanylate cyclase [Thiomicrorhabdus sediminis]
MTTNNTYQSRQVMQNKCIKNFVKRYETEHSRPSPESIKAAKKALKQIEALGVTPSPIHYTLIYEIFNEIDPYLANKVQHALDTNSYDNETAEDIYIELVSHFFHNPIPTEEVKSLLSGLLLEVERWIASSKDNNNKLNDDVITLQQFELSPEVNNHIQKRILPRINNILSETNDLHAQLLQSADEIQQLKNDLEHAQNIAKTDDLTKIPNRRGFNEIILQIAKVAQSEQSSFALILLDIDYFKKINDEFGHLIGDSVLRFLAQQLDSETKGKDRIARFGGEEFVVLLPNTSYTDAYNVANYLRKKIEGNTLKVKTHDKPLKLTISAGVATYQLGENVDKLIERADKALYQAKNTGRNKVCGEFDKQG